MSYAKYKVTYRGRTFLGNSEEDLKNNIIGAFPEAPEKEVQYMVTYHKIESQAFTGDASKDVYVPPEKRGAISFKQAMNGASAIMKVIAGQVVSQAEIERRARICSACVNMSATSDCVGCGFGSRLIDFTRKVKRDIFQSSFNIPDKVNGKYCGICQCALLAMLPSKMSAFDESANKQAERPMHCWVKKESPNYKE